MLLTLLLGSGSFAQSFIVDPANYYYAPLEAECVVHIDVTNNTEQTLEVIVTKIISAQYDDGSDVFCWGSNCYTGNISTYPLSMAPGETSSSYSGTISNMPYEVTNTINYCFSAVSDTSIKTCMDVNYTSLSAYIGVEETVTDFGVYPNPANDVLNVNYTSEKEATFIMYDMLGNEVYNDLITTSKTIQLYDLEAGIYFYTFSVSGYKTEVQKLIITH